MSIKYKDGEIPFDNNQQLQKFLVDFKDHLRSKLPPELVKTYYLSDKIKTDVVYPVAYIGHIGTKSTKDPDKRLVEEDSITKEENGKSIATTLMQVYVDGKCETKIKLHYMPDVEGAREKFIDELSKLFKEIPVEGGTKLILNRNYGLKDYQKCVWTLSRTHNLMPPPAGHPSVTFDLTLNYPSICGKIEIIPQIP